MAARQAVGAAPTAVAGLRPAAAPGAPHPPATDKQGLTAAAVAACERTHSLLLLLLLLVS